MNVSVETVAGEVNLKHVTAKNVEGATKAGEMNLKSKRESEHKTTSGEINILIMMLRLI